jgi:hypothetical protein
MAKQGNRIISGTGIEQEQTCRKVLVAADQLTWLRKVLKGDSNGRMEEPCWTVDTKQALELVCGSCWPRQRNGITEGEDWKHGTGTLPKDHHHG